MIRGPFSAEAAEAFWDEDRWPNFSIKELVCKCGCGEVLWDEDVLDDAQAIRNELGHGLTLSSATRCRTHNNAVSSTGDTGPHTKGALDLAVMGGTAVQVITMASGRGVTGIGIKQHGNGRFVHIDRLENVAADSENDVKAVPRPWVWSYK